MVINANTFFYSTNLISGLFYDINNPFRLNESGGQIFIEDDIRGSLTGTFISQYSSSGVEFIFNPDLTSGEQSTLDGLVVAAQSYRPSPLEDLFRNWESAYNTFSDARTAFGMTVAISGFNNLKTVEKKMAAKWMLLTKAQRDTVVSSGQQVMNEKMLPSHMTIFSNTTVVANVKLWSNNVYTNSSGQAILCPTYDGTVTGMPIFSQVGGVNAVATSGTDTVTAIPFCSLKEINFGNREVVVNVLLATNVGALGGNSVVKAPGGVPIRCMIMGV